MARAALLALLAVAGCGGGDDPAPRPDDGRASTDEECAELWNATARPSDTNQRSPADFLVEGLQKGEDRVGVFFDNGRCEVWAPVAGTARDVHRFVAPRGVPPYANTGDVNLDVIGFGDAGLRTNATVEPGGRLELD